MATRPPKRFRVTGYDENDDLNAFETDSRERAKAMEQQMAEDLREVVCDMRRRV